MLRTLLSASALFLVTGLFATTSVKAADEPVPAVYVIDSKTAGPKELALALETGDSVAVSFDFPIVPTAMIENLKVAVTGKGLDDDIHVVQQIRTAMGKPLLGVGNRTAIVTAESAGTSLVTITPLHTGGKAGTPVKLRITIAERKK